MINERQFPVTISCSRDNHDRYWLRIKDADAVNASVEIELSPAQFAYLVSGTVVDGAKGSIHRRESFGKVRISEDREVECPMPSHSGRDALRQWLLDNCQEDGWELDAYLGSQGSVHSKGDRDE